MVKKILLWVVLLSALKGYASDSTSQSSLVTKRITYTTQKASEIFVYWSLDNWTRWPAEKYWPKKSLLTVLLDTMICSKMSREGDKFSVEITLPQHSYLNFMFWIPIDASGDSTDGWDTYGEVTYSSIYNKNENLFLNDDALWMPEKGKTLSIKNAGKTVFFIVGIAVLILFIWRRKYLRFAPRKLYVSLLPISLVLSIFVRMEMNNLASEELLAIMGSIKYDVLLLLVVTSILFVINLLFRRKPALVRTITVVFSIFLILCTLFLLINVEIVKQLGRPLNYQWLYYSGFMQGTDAKNAVAYNLKPEMISNLIFLVASIILFAVVFAIIDVRIPKHWQLIFISGLTMIFAVGYFQKSESAETGKIENPVLVLISSSISSGSNRKLFSMDVSKEVVAQLENSHSFEYKAAVDSGNTINNIILFVMESTPNHFVSLYDSTYDVTPNLKKWKKHAAVFPNVYSHIPSTSNSLATMNCSLYPLLSYHSIINEYSQQKLPALSTALHNNGWRTSFFSSADLTFGNMDAFAKKYDFEVLGDSKNISCNYPSFTVTNTLLDGLDDKCITTEYLNWYDALPGSKKFSVLWSNQTHYPYFTQPDQEKMYVQVNDELNRYLNALENLDKAFGILMEGLEKRKALENTLVIVVGDHGEAFGTHQQTGHGNKIYEENVNVPFVIYNSRLFSGKTYPQVGGLIDIAPTVSHIIGFPLTSGWQGKSLLSDMQPNRAFFLCPYSDFLFGTRSGDWKYIYNASLNKEELYNLKADPKELNNLSSKHPGICKSEFEMLAGWVQMHSRKLNDLKK